MDQYRETIESLKKLKPIQPSYGLRSRFEHILIPSISGKKIGRSGLAPFRIALAVFMLIVISSGGVIVSSEKSHVGDPLYPVKRALESVEVVLTFDAGEKAVIHIGQAHERVEEMKENATTTDSRDIDLLTNQYAKSIEAAVENVEKADENNASVKATVVEELRTASERLGQVRAEVPAPALRAIDHAIEVSDKAKLELVGSPSPVMGEGVSGARLEEENKGKEEKVPGNPNGFPGKPNPGLGIKDN